MLNWLLQWVMSESRKTMNLFKQLSPANKRELCSQWNHNETESVFVEYHYLWILGCFASKNKMCWWRSHLKIWYCNFPEEWRITAVNRMCSINWFAQLKHEAQQFLHLIVISNFCTLQHQGSIMQLPPVSNYYHPFFSHEIYFSS